MPRGRTQDSKGRFVDTRGYIIIQIREAVWKAEHLVIAERILGKPLPRRANVHHYGKQADNTKLVICDDAAYHKLLHLRTEAYRACSNANARRCPYCGGWDVPGDNNMVVAKRSNRARGAGVSRHRDCHTLIETIRRLRADRQGLAEATAHKP